MVEVGSKVIVLHQRELGKARVISLDKVDPPIVLPDGKIVDAYARLSNEKLNNAGYHLDNLKPVIRVQ